jgi:hypothetical protein
VWTPAITKRSVNKEADLNLLSRRYLVETHLSLQLTTFDGKAQRILGQVPRCAGWRGDGVCLAPEVSQDVRQAIERQGCLVQDLNEQSVLTACSIDYFLAFRSSSCTRF